MNAKIKKKLCWNCEGSAAVHDEHCPFCGVYLNAQAMGETMGESEITNNLYAPPYKATSTIENNAIPPSPYIATGNNDENKVEDNVKEEQFNHAFLPTSLLVGGAVLFFFALILFLFSNNGYLTLKWNASFWPYYIIIGAGMLIFGWIKLKNLEDK